MATQQEWADWLHHPVTETVLQHLNDRKDSLISELVNIDISNHTVESYGIKAIALRYYLEGLGECLDIDTLKELIVEVNQ